MEPIQLGTFYNGLSNLSKLEQNKWQDLTNCDVHSEIGMCQPQYAMASESTTPNEPCISAIAPNGDIYACSTTTGKIWKRTSAGTWSLAHTNANTVHRGARYFNGYLWYWTATKLGTYDLASTWTDSFATGTDFREGVEFPNALFIANGSYIAKIDRANSFDALSFSISEQHKATCIQSVGDDMLIGTYISEENSTCDIILWDTISETPTRVDEIPEVSVNCFIKVDNMVLAQCGSSGRFYYWTGSQMAYFGKIKGITTGLGEQKSVSLGGRPLYANGTKIYSIHKEDNGLPTVFVPEYTCTGTIESLVTQGQNLLASVGTGFDKKGTAFATAIIETPEIQTQVTDVKVGYDTYPEGIAISTNVNGGGYTAQTPRIDPIKKEIWFDGGIADGYTTQVKVTLTPSGASRPIIKYIKFQ